MRRALFGEPAAPARVGRLEDDRIEAGGAYDLACAAEAPCVADLGKQVTGDDRADAVDRLKRLKARIGAGQAAKLAVDLRELLLDRLDNPELSVDQCADVRLKGQPGEPAPAARVSSARREQGQPSCCRTPCRRWAQRVR